VIISFSLVIIDICGCCSKYGLVGRKGAQLQLAGCAQPQDKNSYKLIQNFLKIYLGFFKKQSKEKLSVAVD